jgi:hypothetical protein
MLPARTLPRLIAPLLLVCTGLVVAQEKINPGLWEHSFTMKSQSGQMEAAQKQMQAQMAALPPAQRKQMEEMMAQSGVAMGPKGNTLKVCISKEDAEQDRLPQSDDRCQQQSLQRSGNTVRFKFKCSGEPPTSGEGEFTITSPKAYSGKSTVNTVVMGKAERMELSTTGTWLSADCGKLKPLSNPMNKPAPAAKP